VTIAIRSPIIGLVRNPHVAVVGHFLPLTVGIQVLRTGVAMVGVTPRLGVLDQVIAVGIPAIPVVGVGSLRNLVLGRGGVAANRRHFAAAWGKPFPRGPLDGIGKCDGGLRWVDF